MVPPPGMACSALITRLLITWLIWPGSISAIQRSSSIKQLHLIFEPRKTKRMDSSNSWLIDADFVIGAPPLANVRSWWVSVVAN